MSLPPARYVALAILINIGCALAASVPTMLSQDIKVGDTGYGLTVFEGTRIDTFAVEILAVIRNRTPQQDAIVCRMTGGPLERTGILQGMSGSPVYIDGKLIGAVAWGRSFTTEPLGGITPIESMLRVGRRTLAVPGPRQHVSTPQGNRLGLESMRGDSLPPFDEPVPGWSMMPEGPGFTPLVTPVFASGMDPRSMRRLQELLGAGRFQVIQGGASGAADMADVVIEPGAALGVTLMDGDLNLGGIGTVTWVDGDTVLAFGHPMFLGGRVDFPLSKAMIYFSWPSQIISHKVGAVGPIVGAVRQDRDAAIAGKLGDIPEMLPVKVEIEGPHTTRSFNYRVIRDPDYGPRFAAMGLYNAVIAMEKAGGASTVELTTEIAIREHEPVRQNNIYTDQRALMSAVGEAWRPLVMLSKNLFEPVSLASVSYKLKFMESTEALWVTGIRIPRRVVRPGDQVVVETSFQNYLGEPFSRSVSLRMPADTPEGVYKLRVGDSRATRDWARQRTPGKFRPRNLGQVIAMLNDQVRHDRLTFQILSDKRGMTVDRHVLPALPHSVFEVLRHAASGGRVDLVDGRVIAEQSVSFGRLVLGTREIDVAVYDRARPN